MSINSSTSESNEMGFALSAQDISRMDQIVRSYASDKTFMGTVLVAHGPEILFSKGYGSANVEWDIPNKPSTKFRVGSITKQFTAASILLLAERGLLKVDDLLKDHLAGVSKHWDRITIRHLLTHTSGIPNFIKSPEYPSQQPFSLTVEEVVALFANKPLDFAPGEKWNYSDSGYIVLGHLIEKLSRSTYKTFLHENIFKPLGMNDSGYESNETILPQMASGYVYSDDLTNAPFSHVSLLFAAAGLYSTTIDLLRWEQSLFGGKVLAPASLELMCTPNKNNYACGLWVHASAGHKVIEHGGGIAGFNSLLSYYPDNDLTIAVLANVNGQDAYEVSGKLASVAHGEQVQLISERKEVAVSRDDLTAYAGVYQLAPGVNFNVTVEESQLMVQLSGQPKLPLFAESENRFFLKIVDAQVEFIRDETGVVVALELQQAGQKQKALRKNENA